MMTVGAYTPALFRSLRMKTTVPAINTVQTQFSSVPASTRPVSVKPVLAMATAIRAEYGSCVAIEYLQAHGMSQAEIQTLFAATDVAH
jgi:hypothetical protein